LASKCGGVNIWSIKAKIANTITSSGCVTITDEAFTMLALENYWGRWFHQEPAQWTDSRPGNQQFMGWSDEAYNRYDAACKLIAKQRGTVASKGLEKEFKIQARDTYEKVHTDLVRRNAYCDIFLRARNLTNRTQISSRQQRTFFSPFHS
jgi:hypothetical protein